jgi:hypothetical protein
MKRILRQKYRKLKIEELKKHEDIDKKLQKNLQKVLQNHQI